MRALEEIVQRHTRIFLQLLADLRADGLRRGLRVRQVQVPHESSRKLLWRRQRLVQVPQKRVLDAIRRGRVRLPVRRECRIHPRVRRHSGQRERLRRLVRGNLQVNPDGNERQRQLRLDVQLFGTAGRRAGQQISTPGSTWEPRERAPKINKILTVV